MSKIIDKINIRNIQDLYEIKSITENGQINLKDKYVLDRYKDCIKENNVIQNMTAMIKNTNKALTEN